MISRTRNPNVYGATAKKKGGPTQQEIRIPLNALENLATPKAFRVFCLPQQQPAASSTATKKKKKKKKVEFTDLGTPAVVPKDAFVWIDEVPAKQAVDPKTSPTQPAKLIKKDKNASQKPRAIRRRTVSPKLKGIVRRVKNEVSQDDVDDFAWLDQVSEGKEPKDISEISDLAGDEPGFDDLDRNSQPDRLTDLEAIGHAAKISLQPTDNKEEKSGEKRCSKQAISSFARPETQRSSSPDDLTIPLAEFACITNDHQPSKRNHSKGSWNGQWEWVSVRKALSETERDDIQTLASDSSCSTCDAVFRHHKAK